jgi:uracil-DNA glycosylase family 4
MNAKWAGIPQARKRFFLIFHQPWLPLEFRFNFVEPPTVGEILATIPDPGYVTPTRKDLIPAMRKTPQGCHLVSTWEEMNPGFNLVRNAQGKVKGRPSFQDRRLAESEVMGAYVADKFYHPTKHRRIGVEEAKALCGYPPNFQLIERPGPAIGSMIARAVMPPVGRWLGDAVKAIYAQPRRAWCESTVTKVDLRKPPGIYEDLTREYREATEKQASLFSLSCQIKSCDLCPKMRGRYRIFGQLNGLAEAKILFIGEAPGKDVIGKVGSPLYGDASGDNFQLFLQEAGINLSQVFIVNSVLCCPLDGTDNTIPPSEKEIVNCLSHIIQTIKLLDPVIVVTLGKAGLVTANKIESTSCTLGGGPVDWYERKLLSLYHPSPRTLPFRSKRQQVKDYKKIGQLFTNLKIKKPKIMPTIGSKKSILLTGSTPIQVGSQKTQMKIITSMSAWKNALTEMGYLVDWRKVMPGEDLSGYSAVIAALNKPVSIASRHFYGALWALSTHSHRIAVMDDWQTLEFMPGVKTCVKTEERAFRLFPHVPVDLRPELYKMLQRLKSRIWPWTTIVPVFEGGDISLLGLSHGKIIGIDPTIYSHRYSTTIKQKEKRWIQASLLIKDPPMVSWPITFFGNAGRARGGVGNTNHKAQPRLVEADLMTEYCKVWGVLSPKHPHAGSGWWRVRYLMAADAGCILSADLKEASCLGEPYLRAAGKEGIVKIEQLSTGMLRRWAYDQKQQLAKITWPKEKVKSVLSDLLKEAGIR